MDNVRIFLSYALALLSLLIVTVPDSRAQAPMDANEARSLKLARGVNLPQWYSQSGSYDESRLASFFTIAEAQMLKSAGITHLRLTIGPEVIGGFSGTGALNQPIVERLRERVRELN